jgi:Right handed beta helix region/Secretion system C-terminal sorting domain
MIRLYTIIFLLLIINGLLFANLINVPADYSTIQTAIDSAQVDDTVLVAPGTYVENIDFHGKKLTVASNFIFSKDKTDINNTIIDGNADSSVVSVQNAEPEGTMLIGFTLQNGLGTGDWPNVRGGGIHIDGTARPTIRYCKIHDNETTGSSNRGAGIYASSQFAHISNCEIYGNTGLYGSGITIGNGAIGTVVDSCTIFNNDSYFALMINYSQFVVINRTIIHNNPHTGIRNYGTDSVTVMHSVVINNGDIGITNQANDSQLYLFNSFVGYNQGENIDQDTSRTDNWVEARYSNLIGGTDSLWFGIGCIDTMPEFADTSNYDFSLLSTSPMIDAGDSMLPYDPDGTLADIGVHYFSQGTNTINEDGLKPENFELIQNYPNPFNPVTNIEFYLPTTTNVKIEVFNLLGQKVKTILDANKSPGNHQIQFNADGLASGVYLYKMETSKFSQVRKMVLLQ